MSTQEKIVKARSDTLQQYVSDMIAVETQIGSAVKRQNEDKNVATANPQASQIIQRIMRHTEQHAQELKRHLATLGGDPAGGIKELATTAVGALAGLYDKVRTEPISKMLRDDYTALNLAAVGYTMLHTTGMAVQDHPTAALALRLMKDYTPIIMEVTAILPNVVVAELQESGVVVVESSIQRAIQNTQDAWKSTSESSNSLK
jgi:hypothetical protein